MSDRFLFTYFLRFVPFLFFSYLMGLFIYFPDAWGVAWIRAGVPSSVQWQTLMLGWRGAHWKGVTLALPQSTSRLVLQEVRVVPSFSSLFSGSLSADYLIRHKGGEWYGTVRWSFANLGVQWHVQMDDFSMIKALFSSSATVSGHGRGEGQVELGWNPKALHTGTWAFHGKNLSALGVTLESLTLKGEVAKENRLEVHVSGRGNLAVSGQVAVQVQGDSLVKSQLSGRVKIQPLGRLQGVAAALNGKPATLIFGGKLGQPSWKIQ